MSGLRRGCLLLVAAVVVAFAPLLWSPMMFDDGHAVADNPAIRSLANLLAFFVDPSLFSSTGQRMWRPLVMVSLTLDHWLSGGSVAWFKAMNLTLHLAVVLGVGWFLVSRVGGLAAAAGCIVFALHPLQTEALAMVSARSELIMGLGTVMALCAWWPLPGAQARPLLGVAGMVVALLAKESALALLVVLLVVRWVQARPGATQGPGTTWRTGVLAPLLVLGAWLLLRKLVMGQATTHLPALTTGGDLRSGGTRDLATQLLLQAQLLPRALRLFVLPWGQSLDHALPELLRWNDLRVAGGLCVIGFGAVFVLLQKARRPLLFLGGILAMAFAAPWVLVPLNVPFAEHRLYLPLLGLALGVAALLYRQPLRPVYLGILAVLLGTASFLRCQVWTSEERLWQDVLAHNPRSFRAMTSLGHVRWVAGDVAGARSWFEEATLVYPRYRAAIDGLTAALLVEGEQTARLELVDRGLRFAERTVGERPKDPVAHLAAAEGWLVRGRLSAAAADYARSEALLRTCLQLAEPKATVYCYLAEARAGQGDRAGAWQVLADAAALRLAPGPLRFTRARLLMAEGRFREAEVQLQELLQLDPMATAVHKELAALYRRTGRPEAARGHEDAATPMPGAAPNR